MAELSEHAEHVVSWMLVIICTLMTTASIVASLGFGW